MAVVISDSLVATGGYNYPLTNARIGYQKHAGTITATSAADGYPALAADNELTYSYWKPATSGGTWTITYSTFQDVDYIGIAAHTLGTDYEQVMAEYYDGANWQEIGSVLPNTNQPILFLFESVFATAIRISVTGTPLIGVVYAGLALQFPMPVIGQHRPLTFGSQTEFTNNVSDSGQWLGRSIIRRALSGSIEWQYMDDSWVRSQFMPFVESAKKRPFFLSWNPAQFPQDCGYCWCNSNIAPSYQGIRDFMSVSIQLEGLGYE